MAGLIPAVDDEYRFPAEVRAALGEEFASLDGDGLLPETQVPVRLTEANLSATFAAKAIVEHDLRDWLNGAALPNDGVTSCNTLFVEVLGDLHDYYEADGMIHVVVVPAGSYNFTSRLTPPGDGHFGIRGEGMGRTIFLTPSAASWFGMNEGSVGDPDFSWSHMYFTDFTVDGSAQPTPGGGSYVTGLKGFIAHNFRDSTFKRVRVQNTHATGFGCDHLDNVWFIECEAINCGRGRKEYGPAAELQFGSGSGFGLGFGHVQNSAVYMVNCVASDCGASGAFAEHLGRPESLYRSTTLIISGGLFESNAIGINDAGVRGMQVTGAITRYNEYAGFRTGISNASIPGGSDGLITGLVTYGNAVGVAIEGNSGSYLFDGLEAFENTRANVEIRETTDAFPGRNIRFRNPHLHRAGGPGFLSSTSRPVVGLEITDALVHNNGRDSGQTYRDGITILSPMGKPKIKGRFYDNAGFAVAVRGTTVLSKPVMDLDVTASAGGGLYLDADVDDLTGLNVYGNPENTVQNLAPRPYPDAGLTGVTSANVTLTYAASKTGTDGVDLGPCAKGVAAGSASPRIALAPATVTARKIYTVSAYLIAPLGKEVQPYAVVGATNLYGPIVRATGSVQRVDFPVFVPGGVTALQPGARGVNTTLIPWAAADELYVSKGNVTLGGELWPYTDGAQAHCGWDGTAGSSTSTRTIPAPAIAYPSAPVLIASDAFTGGDVTSLASRNLDNALGGSGTRAWTTPGTSQIGISSGEVYRSGTGAARNMLCDFSNTSGRFELKVTAIGANAFVLWGRWTDDNNSYRAGFAIDGSISLRTVKGGVSTVVKTAPAGSWSAGARVALEVKPAGGGSSVVIAAYVNDVLVATYTDASSPITSGTTWGVQVPNDTTARFDDAKFSTVT